MRSLALASSAYAKLAAALNSYARKAALSTSYARLFDARYLGAPPEPFDRIAALPADSEPAEPAIGKRRYRRHRLDRSSSRAARRCAEGAFWIAAAADRSAPRDRTREPGRRKSAGLEAKHFRAAVRQAFDADASLCRAR